MESRLAIWSVHANSANQLLVERLDRSNPPSRLANTCLLEQAFRHGDCPTSAGLRAPCTHRNAPLNMVGTMLHMPLSVSDRYLWTLPMVHANGWTHVWIMTAVGATHVCLCKVDPANIFERLLDHIAAHFNPPGSSPGASTLLQQTPGTARASALRGRIQRRSMRVSCQAPSMSCALQLSVGSTA
jgi:acyl-CoA synthetase (AMP-forming)/AMP-acid ligase II